MRTGLALFALIGLSMIFDLDRLWPKSSDVTSEQYSYVVLSPSDSLKAVDQYKKTLHLNKISFYKKFFLLSEQKLTKKTHVYFITAKVILIVLAFLWFMEATEYSKNFVLMFLFFLIGDLADYLIIYNENYNHYLSYNILFTGLYGLFLIIMAWKQSKHK